MRFVILLIALGLGNKVQAFSLTPYVGAELVDASSESEAKMHLVVLGSLEKVNHVVEPEASEIMKGRLSWQTFYLPQARRTKRVAEHYHQELGKLGELKFSCKGRSCGSSSYWANRIFEQAILYGPEQYQYYFVALQPNGSYLSVYVGQRATGKIYVYLQSIEPLPATATATDRKSVV